MCPYVSSTLPAKCRHDLFGEQIHLPRKDLHDFNAEPLVPLQLANRHLGGTHEDAVDVALVEGMTVQTIIEVVTVLVDEISITEDMFIVEPVQQDVPQALGLVDVAREA